MSSRSIFAVVSLVILDLVIASPIRNNIVHERGAIQEQNSPVYCQVLGNERAAYEYTYIDVSDQCQNAGLSNKCCVTIMHNGPVHVWREQDRNDLMVTIAEQSKKDGRFDSTNYGHWVAGFDTVIFASKDLVKSELLQVWFNVIKNIKLERTSKLGDVILQIYDGTDDISNYMVVSNLDH